MGPNYTEFSNTEFSNTEFSNTTTTKDTKSSSSNILKWINEIKFEFNIKMTKKYQEQLEDLLSNFNDDVIAYAIDYSSKQGNNPKTYFLKVLCNWKQANIKTIEEAQNYTVTPIKCSQSREKTPKWLEERDNKIIKNDEDFDPQLEEDRKAFLKQLEQDWE